MKNGAQIISQTGTTRGGSPLALSRAPAADLLPWCYWWSVAEGQLPEGVTIECGRSIDHPCLTIIYHDAWIAKTAEGTQFWDPGRFGRALYFGPHTRRMPLAISGRYVAVSLHFHAGAASLLGFPPQGEVLDRIVDVDQLFAREVPLGSLVPLDQGYDAWIESLEEQFLRPMVAASGGKLPDPLVTAFEQQCLTNPGVTVEQFSVHQGVSIRTLERKIKRAFGLTPKQALRRARTLDMGADLLGVARLEDHLEIEDRYFDQSHRIKDVRAFFGMAPSALKNGAHPFLRLGLETRQRRRLAALNLLPLSVPGPWRDPGNEPRAR